MGRDYLIQFADVEIFCDGNKTIGLGHIRRSAALCKNLIDSGISARLTGISATASSLISGQEYRGGSSKIVIFDVFEGIEDRILQAKNDHKNKTFEKILQKIEKKILLASSADFYMTYYQVPEFIIGLPVYKLNDCIDYIIKRLKTNGFTIEKYEPNILIISWLPN